MAAIAMLMGSFLALLSAALCYGLLGVDIEQAAKLYLATGTSVIGLAVLFASLPAPARENTTFRH